MKDVNIYYERQLDLVRHERDVLLAQRNDLDRDIKFYKYFAVCEAIGVLLAGILIMINRIL